MIRAAKYRHIFWYGLSLSAFLFFLRWLQWKLIIVTYAIDIYIALIACLFTGLGIWIALKITNPKTVVVEKQVFVSGFIVDEVALEKLNLRPRELEVLQLLSEGLSNAEIGERLFISISTVKTHISGLFEKLEVKSRTQAIDKAKKLRIIA